MRHCIGYLIAAVLFVGGYAISRIDWSAAPSPAVSCGGGGKFVWWHRSVPDQTSVRMVLPRPAAGRTDGSPLEPRDGGAAAVVVPQHHFC
jgi:hypothetical protein